jgi:hypothetical protein
MVVGGITDITAAMDKEGIGLVPYNNQLRNNGIIYIPGNTPAW